MTNEEFKLWIDGFLTLTDEEYFDSRQLKIIQSHANLVKEMMPNIEPEIVAFVSQLSDAIKNKNHLPMYDVKEIIKSTMLL